MTFYQLDAAWNYGDLWHIGDIAEVADWQFDLLDRAPAPRNLHARVAHHGAETDFSIGWTSFIFMSERARQAVHAAGVSDDEIMFHPVAFDNHTPSQQYYALGIPKVRLCVDEARSEWSPCYYGEGETPMSRGFLRLYGAFFELWINEAQVVGLNAFRLGGAQDAVIVSDRIKDAFDAAGLTGAIFTKVS
jgi:hypothetical protein